MFLEKGFADVYQAQNNRDVSLLARPLSIAIYTITVFHPFLLTSGTLVRGTYRVCPPRKSPVALPSVRCLG